MYSDELLEYSFKTIKERLTNLEIAFAKLLGDKVESQPAKPAPAVAPEISEQHDPWHPGKCPACGYPSKRQKVAEAFLHATLVDTMGNEDSYGEAIRGLRNRMRNKDDWWLNDMAAVLERAETAEAATKESNE